jgi:hypothetical protein
MFKNSNLRSDFPSDEGTDSTDKSLLTSNIAQKVDPNEV